MSPGTDLCAASHLFVAFAPTCHTIWQPHALPLIHRGSRAQCSCSAYNNTKLALTLWPLLVPGPHRLLCGYKSPFCGVFLYICKRGVGVLASAHGALSWLSAQPSCGTGVVQKRNALQGSLKYKIIKYHFNVHNPSHVCIPYLLPFQLEKNAL